MGGWREGIERNWESFEGLVRIFGRVPYRRRPEGEVCGTLIVVAFWFTLWSWPMGPLDDWTDTGKLSRARPLVWECKDVGEA